jgi:hypothetical protein
MRTPHVNADALRADALELIEPLVSVANLRGVTQRLLLRDADELDSLFSDNGALSLLLALIRRTCRNGFQAGDLAARFAAHGILRDIYKLFIRPPDETSSAQGSMVVAAIRGMIERHMPA